jgi:hypothetical protein
METADLRMWAASSGWEGPFQLEEVIVLAPDVDGARRAAEAAFDVAAQPYCRARMRIADLGPARDGAASPPRRGGELLSRHGIPVEIACRPFGGPART